MSQVRAPNSSSCSARWSSGADPDGNNTTLLMVFKYMTRVLLKFESQYMLPDERAYLAAQVASTDLQFANNQYHSMMAIFRKRGPQPKR